MQPDRLLNELGELAALVATSSETPSREELLRRSEAIGNQAEFFENTEQRDRAVKIAGQLIELFKGDLQIANGLRVLIAFQDNRTLSQARL